MATGRETLHDELDRVRRERGRLGTDQLERLRYLHQLLLSSGVHPERCPEQDLTQPDPELLRTQCGHSRRRRGLLTQHGRLCEQQHVHRQPCVGRRRWRIIW